jgi:hypothetical protein
MDSVMLRVEEILGDAFVDAYGLDYPDKPEPPDPDLEDEEEERS